MSLRISSAALLFVLTGCAKAGGEDKVAAADPAHRIDCALGPARDFTPGCALEPSTDGKLLTLRHADGGFRRLMVGPDRQLTSADGVDEVVGHLIPDGRLEIAVASDRYRLPAKK